MVFFGFFFFFFFFYGTDMSSYPDEGDRTLNFTKSNNSFVENVGGADP